MKKIWICWMTICMVLAGWAVGHAEGAELLALPEGCTAVADFDEYEDTLYLLSEETVYAYADDAWTKLGQYEGSKGLSAGEMGLWLCMAGETEDSLWQIAPDGSVLATWALGMRVGQMDQTKTGLLLMESPESGHIHSHSFEGGRPWLWKDGERISLGFEEAIDAFADENGQIYVLYDDMETATWTVARVSEDGGQREKTGEIMPDSVLDISAAADGLYLLDVGNNVRYFSYEEKKEAQVVSSALIEGGTMQKIVCRGNTLYARVWSQAGESLLILDMTQADREKTRTLTVVNYVSAMISDSRAVYMTKWMEENYPEVKLEYVMIDAYTQLPTRLMAGDEPMDIVFGNANLMGEYARSGAFLPLEAMPGVIAAMEESGFVEYEPVMSYDGKLYGVAEQIHNLAYRLNEPLLAELGLTWPQWPYTWTELADWAIPALEGTPYQLFNVLIQTPPGQYLDAYWQWEHEVRLDTPQFRADMEAYQRLWQAGLIGDDRSQSENALARGMHLDQGAYAMLPTLGGQPANSADIVGFYVYSGTENAELAEAFLTEFVSERCQNLGEYGFPGQMLLKDTEGYSREWQKMDTERGMFDYREETEQMRLASYENIILFLRNMEMHNALDYSGDMRAWLDGDMSLDEYIDRTQARLDMIQYE